MAQVIGLGAGGHAKVVIEILRLNGDCEIVGLLDARSELHGTRVLGVEVLGDDSLLSELFGRKIQYAFIGLGSVGDTGPRKRLYEKARGQGFEMISAIHQSASVSASASIGHGPTIMAGAVVNAAARLSDNVIINTGAIVEHDCVIGAHVHIATGACLSGGVSVGESSHIGLGAQIKQQIRVGRNSVVGIGAVVVNDVPDNVVVVGVPARILEKVDR